MIWNWSSLLALGADLRSSSRRFKPAADTALPLAGAGFALAAGLGVGFAATGLAGALAAGAAFLATDFLGAAFLAAGLGFARDFFFVAIRDRIRS